MQFSEHVSRISQSFCEMYNQAHNAEEFGWTLVAGPGYRKALEFLIKDYVRLLHTDKADEIAAMPLAACIKEYVKSEHIRETAKRAAWLGNDETHYLRKWTDKDLNDLKGLIDLTRYWIESEELTKAVKQNMPEGKK